MWTYQKLKTLSRQMAENTKQLKEEIERLQAQNAELTKQNEEQNRQLEHLKNELLRLMTHNLDMAEQLEGEMELRRRVEVAIEIMNGNIERQRNADLQDDGQLMALIELKVEGGNLHQDPNFDAVALAKLMGISHERLNALFRKHPLHHTPMQYIDNLRLLTAMRLLKEKPNYNIASIAEDAGFNHVRTLQRRMEDVIGMSPGEYRALFTRDL